MNIFIQLATSSSRRPLASSLKRVTLLPLGLLAACAPDAPDAPDLAEAALETAPQGIYGPTNQTQGGLSFACTAGAAVTVTGTDGAALAAGAKITGPGVRDIVIENGVVKVTYELMDQRGESAPAHELGAHMLYRRTGGDPGVYSRALSTAYGDWTYFVAPFQKGAVEAHVLTSVDDVAEVAFVFDHALDWPGFQDTYGHTPSWWQGPGPCTAQNGCKCFLSGCGVLERDHTGYPIRVAPFCAEPWCLRRIYSVRLVKTIRVERCAEGYFVGLHSDPSLSPKNGSAANNQASYGERELGTGSGNAVTWSSAGNVFKHPGQAQHGWMGIDDPTYIGSPAGQLPGFPSEQTEGPWWVADLPYHNRAGEIPFVRYLMMEHRLETGVWAFSTGQVGTTVVHFVNDEIEASGMPTRYHLFVGAMPYISDDEQSCAIPGLSGTWRCFPNEPKAPVTAAIQARVPLTWPD